MTIDSEGRITWIPNNSHVGDNNVIVKVIDPAGSNDTQEYSISVINVNDAPIITSTPETIIYEKTVYYYNITAYDIDNDTLTFELELMPEGMSIDSNGRITWIPNNSQVGENNAIVRVMDAQGAYDSQDYNITVININDNPIMPSINNLSATEEQLFYFKINATDIDIDDSVSYYDDSDLFEIDKDTGVISFIPSNGDVGVYIVNITVKDDFGGSTIITISFSIINVNDPPSLESIEELNCNVGDPFQYQVVANDVDPDEVLSFSEDSDLFSIDTNTGEISFIPTKSDVGIHHITITVIDSEGATNQTTMTINIIGPKTEDKSDNPWIWIIPVIIIILILILYFLKRKKRIEPQDDDEIKSNEAVEFVLEES